MLKDGSVNGSRREIVQGGYTASALDIATCNSSVTRSPVNGFVWKSIEPAVRVGVSGKCR
jgi:hypothetical protein